MQKQQLLGALILLALTAGTILAAQPAAARQREAAQTEKAYAELLAATPVAELEGEGISPDGRFEVRTVGESQHYVSGVVTPEKLQVVNTATGQVLWEDMGYVSQSALWSPDGKFLALSYGGRTWSYVRLFETDTWTSWDFTLPDGSPIPEYTFLPEDWGHWERNRAVPEETYHLLLTVGRGGDGEEVHTYRCSLRMEEGLLTGSVLEQTRSLLSESYDFDHDGAPETTELVTVWEPKGERAAWYEVQVTGADGTLLWSETAADFHAGINSMYALKLDGRDYLLQYCPYMGQGYCTYQYRVFSLSGAGEPVVYQENGVEFDINFGSPIHKSFDVKSIAAFLHQVHGYLDSAQVLVDTTWGDIFTEKMDYHDLTALEKALEDYQRE